MTYSLVNPTYILKVTTLLFCVNLTAISAQEKPLLTQNITESKVLPYSLPPLLITSKGKKVITVEDWETIRRQEIIKNFSREMYGVLPKATPKLKFRLLERSADALNGVATRKQVRVIFSTKEDSVYMDILIYIPNKRSKPAPLILGLNFQGNHAVINDSEILRSTNWIPSKGSGVINNRATEQSRGANSNVWPIAKILDRGYAVATVYAGDLDPDYDDYYHNGIHKLYPALQAREDNFSTMGAWAWGLSRTLDYLETDKDINAKQVVLTGFSRMGKAALWAGALDQRFAIVISNESGKGGAALMKRNFGETIAQMTTKFPHWFNKNFRKYSYNEWNLPFDQHMLLALMAPRPLYIGSAADDYNADPNGEFLSLKAAEPVYHLYGIKGLTATNLPDTNNAQYDVLGYHIRSGGHSMTDFDWDQYLNFADHNLKGKK